MMQYVKSVLNKGNRSHSLFNLYGWTQQSKAWAFDSFFRSPNFICFSYRSDTLNAMLVQWGHLLPYLKVSWFEHGFCVWAIVTGKSELVGDFVCVGVWGRGAMQKEIMFEEGG